MFFCAKILWTKNTFSALQKCIFAKENVRTCSFLFCFAKSIKKKDAKINVVFRTHVFCLQNKTTKLSEAWREYQKENVLYSSYPYAARSVPFAKQSKLGWKDSNLRMAGPKPAALPLGHTLKYLQTLFR